MITNANGAKIYTGRPCRNGHQSGTRYVSSRNCVECQCEKTRLWRLAHPESIREQSHRYHAAKRDLLNAKCKAYHEANKERVRAQQRAYHAVNKARSNALCRAYHAANRERINERKRVQRRLRLGTENAASAPKTPPRRKKL